MDIFITWSGDQSLIVAEAMRDFLKRVIQVSKPFLSSEDIRKGQRWNDEIGARLSKARCAILCLTSSNQKSSWIQFEAGAVANRPNTSVSALLLDLDDTQVEWPLAQFQNTKANEQDVMRLVETINSQLDDDKLPPDVLKDSFNQFWPALSEKIAAAKAIKTPHKAEQRSANEMLEELLATSRENARQLGDIAKGVARSRYQPRRFRGVIGAGALSEISADDTENLKARFAQLKKLGLLEKGGIAVAPIPSKPSE